MKMIEQFILKTFHAKIKSLGNCWLWSGPTNDCGYGICKILGCPYYAHRLSYEIHIGTIPQGLLVCHRCDTPNCVNPEHLFLGTQKDNMHDAKLKGKTANKYGKSNYAKSIIGIG
jgi:hypothetical protein